MSISRTAAFMCVMPELCFSPSVFFYVGYLFLLIILITDFYLLIIERRYSLAINHFILRFSLANDHVITHILRAFVIALLVHFITYIDTVFLWKVDSMDWKVETLFVPCNEYVFTIRDLLFVSWICKVSLGVVLFPCR